MASLMMYSRRTGPSAARPSPLRENGVGPEPLSWMSRRTPSTIDDLAKQKGAAVTQLRDEGAELVAGIGHGQRFAELGHGVAGKDGDTLRRGKPGGIEPELSCERLVQPDEAGRSDGGRRQTRKEPLRQPRVAVVKGKDVRWFD